jgi:hypothetical protein
MGSDPVFKDREMGSDPDFPPSCTPAKLLRWRASATAAWATRAGTATRPGLELLTSDHAVAIRIPAAEHAGRAATGTTCARPPAGPRSGPAARTGSGSAGPAARTGAGTTRATTRHASLHPGHDLCLGQVVIFIAVFVGHVDRVEAWWRESASATRWLSLRELPAAGECYSRA